MAHRQEASENCSRAHFVHHAFVGRRFVFVLELHSSPLVVRQSGSDGRPSTIPHLSREYFREHTITYLAEYILHEPLHFSGSDFCHFLSLNCCTCFHCQFPTAKKNNGTPEVPVAISATSSMPLMKEMAGVAGDGTTSRTRAYRGGAASTPTRDKSQVPCARDQDEGSLAFSVATDGSAG